jgi:hypothetical protein
MLRAQKAETQVIHRDAAALNAFRRAREPDFLWCIHCERAYQHGDFRRAGGRQLCPYVSCVGAEVFAWDWEKVRSANPDYPAEPSPGVVYPLFGRGTYLRAG